MVLKICVHQQDFSLLLMLPSVLPNLGGLELGTAGLQHVSFTGEKTFSLCLHSVRERADYVSCLREQGAQRYANTYVDRQVGKPIKTLGQSVLIGRTFLGPTPSTEYINTDKYI